MNALPQTLYNVSFNTHNLDPVLTPKIPKTVGHDENNTIPRVCLADSIEHCIQALAPQNRKLYSGAEIVIRSIDTNQLKKQLISTPLELFKQRLVPDAIENQEYWYKNKITCNIAIKKIKTFDFHHDLAWSCVPLKCIQDIVQCYTKDINTHTFETAKELYTAFIKHAEHNELWDDIDDIWDDITTLTWSQMTVIENVKFYSERNDENEHHRASIQLL